MKLLTNTVVPGDWIVVQDAAPAATDLNTQYIEIDSKKYPAFVDGNSLRIRCPRTNKDLSSKLSVNGKFVGRISITIKRGR